MFPIREASLGDLPAIITIYNESIPAGRSTADTRPITVEERFDWFRKFDPAKRPLWVAEDDGRIAEISTCIASAYHRRALGTYLKQKMIKACPRLGVETLVSMYFDHNEATQRLNDRFGFEVVGISPPLPRSTASVAG